MVDINKNVSVWRGDKTPPTIYHIWVKESGQLYININNVWSLISQSELSDKERETLQNINHLVFDENGLLHRLELKVSELEKLINKITGARTYTLDKNQEEDKIDIKLRSDDEEVSSITLKQASRTSAGIMSKQDKNKLDEIDSIQITSLNKILL